MAPKVEAEPLFFNLLGSSDNFSSKLIGQNSSLVYSTPL